MEILYARCAGLDIHRDTIVACVRLAEAGGVIRFVETFATTTAELERLSEWLAGHGVTCVAMEATGVYWKPVWAVLAGDFELVLANAHHVKAVPGRKTDVNDATWLADLLAHGLIRSSFVPSMPEQALRDLDTLFFFSSRIRHTSFIEVTEFRRVLFRSHWAEVVRAWRLAKPDGSNPITI